MPRICNREGCGHLLLTDFASRMRVRVKRDECGERIIPGKRGHIFEYNSAALGLLFMPGKPRLWANAKRKLRGGGFQIRQDGDEEGIALFAADNLAQVKLAFKIVGIRPKRIQSARQLEGFRKNGAASRISRTPRREAIVAT